MELPIELLGVHSILFFVLTQSANQLAKINGQSTKTLIENLKSVKEKLVQMADIAAGALLRHYSGRSMECGSCQAILGRFGALLTPGWSL